MGERIKHRDWLLKWEETESWKILFSSLRERGEKTVTTFNKVGNQEIDEFESC